jgi:hypothetical protein
VKKFLVTFAVFVLISFVCTWYLIYFNGQQHGDSGIGTANTFVNYITPAGFAAEEFRLPQFLRGNNAIGAFIDWRKGHDVLVFLHIQKTAGKYFLHSLGTSSQHGGSLCSSVNDSSSWRLSCPIYNASIYPRITVKENIFALPTTRPLKLKQLRKLSLNLMKPLPEMWLFSEATYQWPCGIHPFFSAVKSCVEGFYSKRYGARNRQYHYFTLLRNPVDRYISEYCYHSSGNAYWDTVTGIAKCSYSISERTVPECYRRSYKRQSWKNVTLKSFVSCPYNWANNRQVWMLASLDDIFCNGKLTLSKDELGQRLLESAKRKLETMAFFGITEYLNESALLFEHVFNIKLHTFPSTIEHSSNCSIKSKQESNHLYHLIHELNKYDILLYEFALKLFRKRLLLINNG